MQKLLKKILAEVAKIIEERRLLENVVPVPSTSMDIDEYNPWTILNKPSRSITASLHQSTPLYAAIKEIDIYLANDSLPMKSAEVLMASRRNTSVLWYHFEKNDSMKAKCNVCNQQIKYSSTSANLKSHLKRKHITIYASLQETEAGSSQQTRILQYMSNSGEAIPSSSSAQQQPTSVRQRVFETFMTKKISSEQKKMIDHDLMDMFIDSFHAFSLVEERAFKKLMRWIPGYVLPSRKTVSGSMLEEQHNKAVENTRAEVLAEAQTICITLDVWTTRVTEAYVAVTDHYITDNYTRLETRNLKTVLLGCCQLEGAHTSENLAIEIQTILDNRKFLQKVTFAISDNASNMKKSIKDILKIKHYGCFAHTINLIVNDGLKLIKSEIDIIKKIVSHFRRSVTACEKMQQYGHTKIDLRCRNKVELHLLHGGTICRG
ncbi:zinc finger BED domain-containing protein 4-like [Ctenocephalides felis]|uniref:zinc finger BED domain-containing protein 4-like n=1 Tax=Ctenocephalides felis TaxID=7515 RepID=UPI000E6E41AC|nr:zinc finger BED domain-containing protein 4-like [Ctenocephalides felis]